MSLRSILGPTGIHRNVRHGPSPEPEELPMHPLASTLRRAVFFLWHARIRRTLARPDRLSLLGFDLVVAPGVLNPRHFLSSRFLAEYVAGLNLAHKRVAEVGTGSGLAALAAARAGAHVTALDVDPAAVQCAWENGRRNGLADRIHFLRSDVWEGVDPALQFDLVISNPPFYPRNAHGPGDLAFAAGAGYSFFSRLAGGLRSRLAENGSLVLVHSSDVSISEVTARLQPAGLSLRSLREHRGLFETLFLNEFRARLAREGPD